MGLKNLFPEVLHCEDCFLHLSFFIELYGLRIGPANLDVRFSFSDLYLIVACFSCEGTLKVKVSDCHFDFPITKS